jgi:hypothetical protein
MDTKSALVMGALASLASTDKTPHMVVPIKYKVKTKRPKSIKKPGHGRPAKGYDPITKTWMK